MKSGKREIVEGTEQPHQKSIRTLGEKENHKYLEILEVDSSKQAYTRENNNREPQTKRKILEPSSSAEISSKG